MSKFFYVTLYNDVVLDDSQTSNVTGWSSQKILEEILNYRITRFESLEDVDVTNKKNKQVVVFSSDSNKFTTVDLGDIGEETGLALRQRVVMGVNGTEENPQEIDLDINTIDFKVPRVNVLKFVIGDENTIKTLNTFNNAENSSFINDDMILLDDKAHLKTKYDYQMNFEKDLSEGKVLSCDFDKSIFKDIDSFEDNMDGVNHVITANAIPPDRFLMPNNDINLSYVNNIDYFKITGTGINIKIVCSVDSGQTWKTFNIDHWEDINLTIDSVKAKGIDLDVFNAINDQYWNLLNKNKKIRFAYLFYMDSIDDVEEVDILELQYDGVGKWVQASEDTYDVVYESNSILQVFIKFEGDIKINY